MREQAGHARHAEVRRSSGEQIIERATEAVDVGTMIGLPGVVGLLGRHEGDSAHHVAGRVKPESDSSEPTGFASGSIRARPRSRIFTVPPASRIRFDGLMSRW